MLGAQKEVPELEAGAEPVTDGSQSGGAISGSHEERDTDVGRRYEAAKAKRTAHQPR